MVVLCPDPPEEVSDVLVVESDPPDPEEDVVMPDDVEADPMPDEDVPSDPPLVVVIPLDPVVPSPPADVLLD